MCDFNIFDPNFEKEITKIENKLNQSDVKDLNLYLQFILMQYRKCDFKSLNKTGGKLI